MTGRPSTIRLSRRALLGAGVAAMALLPAGVLAAPRAPRSDVVLILLDDLGIGDTPSFNHWSAIPTPNIDRLAAQGMRLTAMHSSSAVCTPSRYSLLTGRYCWRSRLKHGVLDGSGTNLIEGLGCGGFSEPRMVTPAPGGVQGQLYDLAIDPREEDNLYDQRPEIVSRLARALATIRLQGRSKWGSEGDARANTERFPAAPRSERQFNSNAQVRGGCA